MIQQEKMAAFGLLAAGIAHEVGNPLAALSSLVQMLQRRGPGPVHGRQARPGRPAVAADRAHDPRAGGFLAARVQPVRAASASAEVVEEALGIAKYYQRTKQRSITTDVPLDLPAVVVMRDYLIQVVLNLVLNAIDATEDQGKIHVEAHVEDAGSC